jgi:RHS repeat-associated protein
MARTTALAYKASGAGAGYLDTITDPLSRITQFDYDLAGRVTRQTQPGSRSVGLAYDANGNSTSITPPGRTAHGFAFNALNQISSYAPPDVAAGTNSTTYTYNADSQLARVSRPDGVSVDVGYDSAGRTRTLSLPRGQVSYDYNAAGQLVTLAAPGALGLSYAYDGRLQTSATASGSVAGSLSRTYDTDFRVASLGVNGSSVALQYDADGLLTRAGALTLNRSAQNGLLTGTTLGNVTDAWGYNGLAEPTSYSAQANAAAVFAQQFSRDALGRISQKTETIGGVTDTYGYTYDEAARLKEVRKNGVLSATYAYDGNGNRLNRGTPLGTTSGTYDAQDRLVQYGTTTYAYSANGELQSRTNGAQVTTYGYDQLGNLVSAQLPEATQLSYVIDARSRRIGKSVNGTLAQRFLYQDSLRIAAELDVTGSVIGRFVYGTRVSVPEYVVRGGNTYRIVVDQLGSARLVVDTTTGQIVQRMDYDEFGNVTQDTNPGFQPFGFAGGVYDRDTKLVRFGARDYDPETGRWTTKDPLRFSGGQGNLYRYSGNDPVNSTDPSGLDGPKGPFNLSDGPFSAQKSGLYSQYSLSLDLGPLSLQGGLQVNDPRDWAPNPDPNSPWTPSNDVSPSVSCSVGNFGGFLQSNLDLSSLTLGAQYQNGPFSANLGTKLGDWTTSLELDYNNGSNLSATFQLSGGPGGGGFSLGIGGRF